MIPIRDSQPSYSTPVLTVTLIFINVAVFLYQQWLDPFSANDFVNQYGFVPERLSNNPGSAWTMLTSMFMHGGWLHLIGNMLFLWVFGDNIEETFGHGRFLAFYLGSGIAAALAQHIINPHSRIPMVGASGAIAGVMGAYLILFPHSRITVVGWFLFVYSFELSAWVLLLYWLALQLFSGVGSIADVQAHKGGTAFWAHVGGFVAGVVMAKVMKKQPRYRTRPDLTW